MRDAGLTRITVSLDALDDATFRAMNDVDFPVSDVLDAWVAQNLATWAPSSARDQQSRVRAIQDDAIARLPLAMAICGTSRVMMCVCCAASGAASTMLPRTIRV